MISALSGSVYGTLAGMNHTEDISRNGMRGRDSADEYDARSAHNDAVLGLIPQDRRKSDPDTHPNGRNGQYPHSVPRNTNSGNCIDADESELSMAGHPLFCGLLQELPARTRPPSPEWLDQWTATARSILELLYKP